MFQTSSALKERLEILHESPSCRKLLGRNDRRPTVGLALSSRLEHRKYGWLVCLPLSLKGKECSRFTGSHSGVDCGGWPALFETTEKDMGTTENALLSARASFPWFQAS